MCPVVRADVTCYWKDMWRRLDAMRRLWQLCDVRLRTDDGSSFMAHSPVLAASSDVLHHMLVAARHETFVDGPGIVPVHNVTPDVLRITLDFIYGVTPTSRADFERLRVGAARLGIEGAYEYCCRRLGENASGFRHSSDVAVLSPGMAAVASEATAVVEPSVSTVSEDLASPGDQNSANQTTESGAVVAASEVSEAVGSVDTMIPSSDDHHTAVMAHMTLADLAQSNECPHLRRLAGEILPAPILEAECLAEEPSGSLDDSCDFLDSVTTNDRIRNNKLTDNEGSSVQEAVNALHVTGIAGNESAARTDTVNNTSQSLSCALSSASQTAALASLSVEAQNIYDPQTILNDSMAAGSQHSAVNETATTSLGVAATMDFSSPLYVTADFPAMPLLKTEMTTHSQPAACVSYINDCYPNTCLSGNTLWHTDHPVDIAGTTAHLPSLNGLVNPFGASAIESDLSTADIVEMDGSTVNSICSTTADTVDQSADVLNGRPPLMNFTDFAVSVNHWPNSIADRLPQVEMRQVASTPADNSMMYFGQSSVASTVAQFVPPVFTMNPLSSSSLPSTAAGVAADLSYISLDDVSAVLKANGFSDKTSSPSAGEVSPENRTAESCTGENRTGESHPGEIHGSDVDRVSTETAVNETPSSAARVCIFCQKSCKSER